MYACANLETEDVDMIDTTTVNERIWQIEKLKELFSSVKSGNDLCSNLQGCFEGGSQNKMFWDALYNIKAQFFDSLRKMLIEELRKELAVIDDAITDAQQKSCALFEAAENAIGESLV